MRRSYRIPNSIIAARVALAFVTAGLLVEGSPVASLAAVGLVVVVMAMDALDGIVARRMGLASDFGGVLDITADRIVEHVFWITFAALGQVGLWVPLVVMARSFLVDAVRGLALASGRTAFGERSLARSELTRFLTASRVMRNAYGAAKLAAFVLLGAVVTAGSVAAAGGAGLSPSVLAALELSAGACVMLAVGLCLVRGVPVLADARAYLRA
jgi:CDP-diacylglycerol--glycerol-3-phosphate 3-phosphatidyltransferase